VRVLLRRRTTATGTSSDADQVTGETDETARAPGKGRPTPKRSEVERARRQPYSAPPKDRKGAAAQDRTRRQAEQKRRMEAMRRGEEWALPVRDRGQVRALARDYVDSRKFIVSEYILFAVFLVFILLFALGSAKHSSLVLLVELGILLVIAGESAYHGARVTSLARRRFPGESTKGMTWYVTKRAIRLRSGRIPPPRVSRGEAI
jgi:hypothetical protein